MDGCGTTAAQCDNDNLIYSQFKQQLVRQVQDWILVDAGTLFQAQAERGEKSVPLVGSHEVAWDVHFCREKAVAEIVQVEDASGDVVGVNFFEYDQLSGRHPFHLPQYCRDVAAVMEHISDHGRVESPVVKRNSVAVVERDGKA